MNRRIAICFPTLFDKRSPFNHIIKDIVDALIKNGDYIVILMSVTNYINDSYKDIFSSSGVEYIEIQRKESKHSNFISRYFRDTTTSKKIAKVLRRINVDVLLEDISYSSYWTVKSAKKSGINVVGMLQDIWPDNAVKSSIIKENGLLFHYFEKRQRYVYDKVDRIICISDDMKTYICKKRIDANKVSTVFNWGYSDSSYDISWNNNLFVSKYNIDPNYFYVVYAGNIGKMQNIELIVKAALKMEKYEDIRFLIVGDGNNKDKVVSLAHGLKNISFYPLQPSILATHIYSMAGINVIPLVEDGINTALPSKTGVVLSCSRPVVFCIGDNTQFGALLSKYNAGYAVSSKKVDDLVNIILRTKSERVLKNNGAQKLFMDIFTKTKNVRKYVNIIEEC